MPIIPASQLSLMRKRRLLKSLMDSGEWEKLLEVEADLFVEVDAAVRDPQRSSKELLAELGSVIRLYRELSDVCCLHGQDYRSPQS